MLKTATSLQTAQIIVELLKNDSRSNECQDLSIDCYINPKNGLEQGFSIQKFRSAFKTIDVDNPIRLDICEEAGSNTIVVYKTTWDNINKSNTRDESIHLFERDFDFTVDFIFKQLYKYLPRGEK